MKTQEEENIDQLNREYSLVQNRYNQILLENELLLARLNNIQAKEYLDSVFRDGSKFLIGV